MVLLVVDGFLFDGKHFCSLKFQVIWLNNGGKIMSNFEDWIKLTIQSTALNSSITCTEGRGFTYTPGTTRGFKDFWFSVDDYVTITLEQYNFFSANDAISMQTLINQSLIGYYSFNLTLSQFRVGGTLSFGFQGFSLSVSVNDYTQTAPYYALFRLINQTIPNNTVNLPPGCSIPYAPITTNIKKYENTKIVAVVLFLVMLISH